MSDDAPTPRWSRRPRGPTETAMTIHQSIPADRWCVTAEDLKYLKHEVKSGIQTMTIRPPADGTDDFQMWDQIYGPSIYTVNEQYIKPTTSSAGKMSWALMRNPEGLKCDMFISHAWLEGVFEFLSKVKHSWPRGVQTAWCCMLANPQNLNIESYLQSPSESPFALALRASEVVLVVPNRHTSVYTRLWCAYEAYLAHQEGKTILIAKRSNLRHIFVALLPMTMAALTGIVVGLFARRQQWPFARQVTVLGGVAAVGAYNCQQNQCRMILNLFCEMICWEKLLYWTPQSHWSEEWGFPWQVHFAAYLAFFSMASLFFCLMELDRVSAERTASEAEQLRQGYRGSIHHADCSRPEDAQRIQKEIAQHDAEAEVDFAIHILLTAGMSTPALRDIARAGVDIQRIAYSGVASSVVLLFPVDLISFTFAMLEAMYLQREGSKRFLLSSCAIVERIVLAILIYRCSTDERCFLLKVMDKIVAGLLIGFVILCILTPLTMSDISRIWISGSILGFALMIGFALLGIRGTAKLPFGLCFLQFFLGRGWTSFAACCCPSFPQADSYWNLDAATETGSDSARSSMESETCGSGV